MGTTGLLLVAVASVALLLVAVIRLKVPAFLALLAVSILTAVVAAPVNRVVRWAATGGLPGTIEIRRGAG